MAAPQSHTNSPPLEGGARGGVNDCHGKSATSEFFDGLFTRTY